MIARVIARAIARAIACVAEKVWPFTKLSCIPAKKKTDFITALYTFSFLFISRKNRFYSCVTLHAHISEDFLNFMQDRSFFLKNRSFQ